MQNLLTDIYASSFAYLANLKYLNLDAYDTYPFPRSLVNVLSSTTCCLSSIVDLRIKIHNLNNRLCLLDGCLSESHTFIVNFDHIHDPLKIINNTVKNYIQ